MKNKWVNEELGLRAVFKHYRCSEKAMLWWEACLLLAELGEEASEPTRPVVDDATFLPEHDYLPVFHYSEESDWEPGPRGGATYCFLYDETGAMVATGQAVCSFDDQFCYETGRIKAYGRAIGNAKKALGR